MKDRPGPAAPPRRWKPGPQETLIRSKTPAPEIGCAGELYRFGRYARGGGADALAAWSGADGPRAGRLPGCSQPCGCERSERRGLAYLGVSHRAAGRLLGDPAKRCFLTLG
jgi:hypothetical protein